MTHPLDDTPDTPLPETADYREALVQAFVRQHQMAARITQLEGTIRDIVRTGVPPHPAADETVLQKVVPALATWPSIYLAEDDEDGYDQCCAEIAVLLDRHPVEPPLDSVDWGRLEVLSHVIETYDDAFVDLGEEELDESLADLASEADRLRPEEGR
jgi:hypothetical protein